MTAKPVAALPEAPCLTDLQILHIADEHGQRWSAPDEEGVSFEKSEFFAFARALLAAQAPADRADVLEEEPIVVDGHCRFCGQMDGGTL